MDASGVTRFVLWAGLAALWLQLFASCLPIWVASEYYTYGWYVPPAALLFFVRRWRDEGFGRMELRPLPGRWLAAIALILLLPLFVIRTLGYVDAGWRPPILLQALMVASLSHGLISLAAGWRRSLWFLPLTIFALSAVPHPYQIEQAMIQKFTAWVVDLSVGWFGLMDRPVSASGVRLESMGEVVEVSQGCSGIRSFQSILMASLFFGELFMLGVRMRGVLVVFALGVTLLVNAGRAIVLATIRFDRGEAAFDSAHDSVGFAAFAASAVMLLVAALFLRFLEEGGGRRKLRIRKISGRSK